MRFSIIFLFFCIMIGCQAQTDLNLESLLKKAKSPVINKVLKDVNKYEPQIIYIQIDRDENQIPHFSDFSYNVDSTRYFYPASTVKMPTAILALEKLHELGTKGLNKHTAIQFDSTRAPQTSVHFDPTAKDSILTIGHYVKHIFVVSNNDANNRLYEFVGQDELHQRLKRIGLNNTSIVHRLGDASFGPIDNKYANPYFFYNQHGERLFYQNERRSQGDHFHHLKSAIKGRGFIDKNDSLIYQPFDFSKKNFFPLMDQVKTLKSVIFPEAIPDDEQLNLSEEDFTFIRTQMSKLPRESKYPNYADTSHYDSYVKFFINGDSKEPIPDHVRVFNKVGWAYGYLTDCSYIVDFKNNIEFILAATIHVNENEIYNDGNYEYEEIGLPYLSKLGSIIYEYEINRERKIEPDLSRFKLSYIE